MLKYLIVLLDDTSTSFCHYENDRRDQNLISLEKLKQAVLWSMKENLMVQFLYPYYELPKDYKEVIDEIDHVDIVSSTCADADLRSKGDIVIFNSFASINNYPFNSEQVYVFRSTFSELLENSGMIKTIIPKVKRLNFILTNIPALTPEIEINYINFLDSLGESVKKEYEKNHPIQVNVLTDRMMLEEMNNCNAGWEHLTLAPDGNFYICPAFYVNDIKEGRCGNLEDGPKVRNEHLFKLSHAPICRECDAYQCNRCIWLNQLQTLEVNCPGKEQCVTSHLERNTSLTLLKKIRELCDFMPGKEIPEIEYLDPFEKISKNK